MGEKEVFEKIPPALGAGGFAQTWHVRILDPDLAEEWGETEVAIKAPLDKEKERVLAKEVELNFAIHQIQSAHIVKYLGFVVFEGKLVMVMKYYKDGSLRNILGGKIGKWKRLDYSRAVPMVQDILEGMVSMHETHIVHRDIKPENILMEGEKPFIADFGIGRMLTSGGGMAITQKGTYQYMSPELLTDGIASFNTDVWSLGVTFYEMLCGQYPFGIALDTPQGRLISLIVDPAIKATFPEDLDLPPDIKEVALRMLEKDPKRRYASARLACDELRAAAGKFSRDPAEAEINEMQDLLQDIAKAHEAERKLKNLIERFPESDLGYMYLGEIYNKIGNYGKAVEVFSAGIAKKPDTALLHWGLAIAREKMGKIEPAMSALRRAMDLGLEGSLRKYATVLYASLEKRK